MFEKKNRNSLKIQQIKKKSDQDLTLPQFIDKKCLTLDFSVNIVSIEEKAFWLQI